MARLLGRSPAGAFTVVVRRRDGTPAVIENAPFLDDDTPMPTRFWLVDAEVRDTVSRLEAAGGVRRAEATVDAEAVADAHARYAAARDAAIAPGHVGPRPSGGVGGHAGGSSASTPIWRGTWRAATTLSAAGRWTSSTSTCRRSSSSRARGDAGVLEQGHDR